MKGVYYVVIQGHVHACLCGWRILLISVCVVVSTAVCWNEQLEHSYWVTSTKVQKAFNYSVVSVGQHLGFLMCSQMRMFAIAHRAVVDTVSESALKVDSGRKILTTQGTWTCISIVPTLHICTQVSVHSQPCTHRRMHAHTHMHTHTHTSTHRGINYRVKRNTASPVFTPTPHPSPPADKLTGDVAADLPHVVQMGEDLINTGLVLLVFLCPARKHVC